MFIVKVFKEIITEVDFIVDQWCHLVTQLPQSDVWVDLYACFSQTTKQGMGGSRGGVQTPSQKGFLSNTAPDPLKNHEATRPAFNVHHHRPTSETPFKWRFTGRLMVARF